MTGLDGSIGEIIDSRRAAEAETGACDPAAHVPAAGFDPKRADSIWNPAKITYSICTLVTRPQQYEEMRRSFLDNGFGGGDVEFLYLDNSEGNTFDGYSGCNLFLNVARGDYVIICHQDVLLERDGRAELDERLAELQRVDPRWAVCGNSGGVSLNRVAIRISDPHGEDTHYGQLPALVKSLDENFVVVKRRARIALSADLSGFHLYGADLCIAADILGHTSYVIDFHLRHLSGGRVDASFHAARTALVRKYARSFRPRWVRTSCTTVFLSSTPLIAPVLNHPLLARFLRRVLTKRNPGGSRP